MHKHTKSHQQGRQHVHFKTEKAEHYTYSVSRSGTLKRKNMSNMFGYVQVSFPL